MVTPLVTVTAGPKAQFLFLCAGPAAGQSRAITSSPTHSKTASIGLYGLAGLPPGKGWVVG